MTEVSLGGSKAGLEDILTLGSAVAEHVMLQKIREEDMSLCSQVCYSRRG